jgi:phage head maturation protease
VEIVLRAANKATKNNNFRSINAQIRAVEDENSRNVVLSFSSEEPYERWFGTEILDHSDGACDLSRLEEVGVLLFNHNTDRVIGKVIRTWIENNRGYAEVSFDEDEASDVIYQKVKSGTLRCTSVWYRVDSWEEVAANKTSADGRFTGPCSIARKWMPYEVSIVSVPADPTVGVGRNHNNQNELAYYEAQFQINLNSVIGGKKL